MTGTALYWCFRHVHFHFSACIFVCGHSQIANCRGCIFFYNLTICVNFVLAINVLFEAVVTCCSGCLGKLSARNDGSHSITITAARSRLCLCSKNGRTRTKCAACNVQVTINIAVRDRKHIRSAIAGSLIRCRKCTT